MQGVARLLKIVTQIKLPIDMKMIVSFDWFTCKENNELKGGTPCSQPGAAEMDQ